MAPLSAKPGGGGGGGSKAKASAAAARRKGGKAGAPAASGGTSVSMSKRTQAEAGADAAAAGSSSGDVFARNLSLMAVAHLARGVGFDAVQRPAADVLCDVLAKYVQRIGAAAKDAAELAGRTQPRATDVTQALRELAPAPVALQDLVKALETAKRPFPRDVPAFPARKRDLAGNTIEQTKIGRRENLPPHVPGFLPPLPNRHTYSSESRLVVEREQDTKRVRLELLGQKSQVRQSLHGLQTAASKTPAPIVHQPSWNAFQGSTGENATENPFVQAPVVSPTARSIFARPDREFAPNVEDAKAQTTNQLENTSMAISKLSNSQDLGKEEKILSGTFHDGDSE